MTNRFENKVVIVTGAANGLGKETALGFARQGASLCLVDFSGDLLQETCNKVEALGARALTITTDLGIRENCLSVIDQTINHFGKLDVLCNIAGIVRLHKVEDVTTTEWDQLMAINMAAPFWLSQAAMPHLIKSHGNIINCTSQSSEKGSAYVVPYSMTKGAVKMLTKSMAMEFINEPVRINAVAPGTMKDTLMGTTQKLPEGCDVSLLARYGGIRPGANAEEVATMFLFLASDEARNIHGAIMHVDGGVTAD